MLDFTVRLLRGVVHDQFVQWTEGVIAHEALEDPCDAPFDLTVQQLSPRHARIAVVPEPGVLRVGVVLPTTAGERFLGLGARHGPTADQSGRGVQLGADRRYTGPDCPPDMLDGGGIPQGDYAPMPFVNSSAGWAAWIETFANGTRFDFRPDETVLSVRAASGPLVVHLFTDGTALARLQRFLRLTGMPALLPEWAYGHWKSRDVYEHQSDVEGDFEGYARHGIALDAIVVDSPWETTYNTWEPNPHQFPDFEAMVRRFRAAGVRTVVWTTPWTNLESVDGQCPPDPGSLRLASEPASNYAEGAEAGHFVRGPGGAPHVARWWMGKGSPVDFTSHAAERWWRDQAKRVLEMGVQGIKADDGEGYYFPDDVRFADGRSGAQAAWAQGLLYRRCMQRALDEVHPGEGVLFGRPGWTGQQAVGMTWGGDQASDFWSLRTLVAATITAAASGYSNWSHDVGGYLGERLVARCPKELLIRWVQFGCFTPLMQAHGRFEQEAWSYDPETLDLYRAYVLLHERLVPYVMQAARAAAQEGVPIIRPLAYLDPEDERGWTVSDAYGYGPSLWVAPVLEAGARSREVIMPRGDWTDLWTGEPVAGGGTVVASAPLDRIPAFVRAGAEILAYRPEDVSHGLGAGGHPVAPLLPFRW